MRIIVLFSPTYFFLFVLPRIIINKSKTTIFSLPSNMVITSLFWQLTTVSTRHQNLIIKNRHQRNLWSVKNVQKYYNYKSVYINCQEILCHAALEVLRVNTLDKTTATSILIIIMMIIIKCYVGL